MRGVFTIHVDRSLAGLKRFADLSLVITFWRDRKETNEFISLHEVYIIWGFQADANFIQVRV